MSNLPPEVADELGELERCLNGPDAESWLEGLSGFMNKQKDDLAISQFERLGFPFEVFKASLDSGPGLIIFASYKNTVLLGVCQDWLSRKDYPHVVLGYDLGYDGSFISCAIENGKTVLIDLANVTIPVNAQSALRGLSGEGDSDADKRWQQLLSEELLMVACEVGLPEAEGDGEVFAYEILRGTPPVLNLIKEGNFDRLDHVIANSSKNGMTLLVNSLHKLREQGKISGDTFVDAYRQHCIA